MKKFLVLLLVLPYIASAQTPADEPGSAAVKMEESRTQAAEFEGAAYFPGEWEAAEAKYAEAGTAKSPDAYKAATDAFDAVFRLTIPLYAQAREDEIMELRNTLTAAGIKKVLQDYLGQADKAALETLDQYEAKDYIAAKESSVKAISLYQSLTSIYAAWLIRGEIEANGFDVFDPDNFKSAGEVYEKAAEAYKGEDLAAARENADEAMQRYNLVISTAWAGYAQQHSTKAVAERQAALDLKANITLKEFFTEADSIYQAAADLFDSGNYEEAAEQFINAETLFIVAGKRAAEKRQNASEQIKKANEKIKDSEEKIKQAEAAVKGEL